MNECFHLLQVCQLVLVRKNEPWPKYTAIIYQCCTHVKFILAQPPGKTDYNIKCWLKLHTKCISIEHLLIGL